MKKTLISLATVAALSASATANAALVQTIDLFNTSQSALTDYTLGDGGLFSQVSTAGTDIIGGYRDLGVELVSKPPESPSKNVSMVVEGGTLSFSTSSQTTGRGLIRWDGSTAASSFSDPSAFLLGAAFNPLGSFFELKTIFSDGNFLFELGAFTSEKQWSKVTINAHQVDPEVLPDGIASLIPLSAFGACGYSDATVSVTCGSEGAVDWNKVGALQAIIDPTGSKTSLDLTLNQVTVVPEPASLALLGLGLAGLGVTRRRKVTQ